MELNICEDSWGPELFKHVALKTYEFDAVNKLIIGIYLKSMCGDSDIIFENGNVELSLQMERW